MNVHSLGRRDLRLQASLFAFKQDRAQKKLRNRSSPQRGDAHQTRMMGSSSCRPVADEPADSDGNLSLAHQFAIMDYTDA